jgi:hypothetical protein
VPGANGAHAFERGDKDLLTELLCQTGFHCEPCRGSIPATIRSLDKTKNVLVYVVTSTKVVEGSPLNSISVVPLSR